MGEWTPTRSGEGYTTFLLFIYSFIYKHKITIFSRNMHKYILDKVMKFLINSMETDRVMNL